MNILFVNEVAGFVGGVEQNIVLSAQALTERGHTCHLLYSRQAGGATEFLRLFASSSDQLGGLGEGRFLSAVSPDVAYLHRVSRVMPFLGRPFWSMTTTCAAPGVTNTMLSHTRSAPRRLAGAAGWIWPSWREERAGSVGRACWLINESCGPIRSWISSWSDHRRCALSFS